MFRLASVIFLAVATAATAQTCPQVPDQSEQFDALVAGAQAAENELAGREFTGQMWQIWATAPDDKAQEMLDTGMQRFSEYNFDAAVQSFDQLIEYCPLYAEGYNQRAFVNYLRNDLEQALVDLDRALELSPNHVAAMSGKALTLMQLGRKSAGQLILRQALRLNPWLSERSLLVPEPGEDI